MGDENSEYLNWKALSLSLYIPGKAEELLKQVLTLVHCKMSSELVSEHTSVDKRWKSEQSINICNNFL